MGVWLPSTFLFHNLPFTHPGPGETTSDCYWPQKQLNSHIRTSFKNATQTVTVTMEQSDYATSDVICILNYIIKQHRATQQFIEPIWQSIVETTGDNNMHLRYSYLSIFIINCVSVDRSCLAYRNAYLVCRLIWNWWLFSNIYRYFQAAILVLWRHFWRFRIRRILQIIHKSAE